MIGPLTSRILTIAIPAGMGMLFTTLYNVVDTYFAGRYLGIDALAGLGYSFPLYFFIIAALLGLQQSVTTLYGYAKNSEEEDRVLGQAMVIAIFIGAGFLLMALTPVTEWLLRSMGAEGQALEYAVSYLRIVFCFAPAVILGQAVVGAILSCGDAKVIRNSSFISLLANIILDPLLIVGWGPLPALGFDGIAWATGIIYVMMMLYVISYAIRVKVLRPQTLKMALAMSHATQREILTLAAPTSLSLLLVAAQGYIFNGYLSAFGEVEVAGYTSALRIEQIFLLPVIGLSSALLALASRAAAKGEAQDVRELYATSLKMGLGILVVAFCLVQLLAPVLVGFFSEEVPVIEAGSLYLRLDAFAFPAYLMMFMGPNILLSLKRPLVPFMAQLTHKVLMPLSMVPLAFWIVGANTLVLWSTLVVMTWIVGVVLTWMAWRGIDRVGVGEAERG